MKTNFLDMIRSPRDLKVLNKYQLGLLANEIRDRIIKTVAKTGGHLGPSLGTVELTIALHYIFNSPKDKIVWDVGHQSYTHKILTGRNQNFETLRQYKGISGFPRTQESEHDAFGVGHASTSISAALGLAKARDLRGEKNKVIAVIGDGALTGGEAFEGLNNAGHLKTDLIVVLNDNGMSISENVSAWASYIRESVASQTYGQTKTTLGKWIKGIPLVEQAAYKAVAMEDAVRAITSEGQLFRQFGFRYWGPIDGNDLEKVMVAMRNIKDLKGPVLLHVKTEKGKGYRFAETQKAKFHGIGSFNVENGEKIACAQSISYSDAFGNFMIHAAERDKNIVAISAAMTSGTGLEKFSKKFPDRFFDVGIAEGHAVTFAAGLSIQGIKPVVAIYSTFLQRAYDQIVHDVCLQNLPVVFAIDRAGLVGEDGATHQGVFDISFLRNIPNLVIMAPRNECELTRMMQTAINAKFPLAIRYPKGCGDGSKVYDDPKPIKIGKAKILRHGHDVAIISVGPLTITALNAANSLSEEVDCRVIDARSIKPLDRKKITEAAKDCKKILTIEDGVLQGGFGSAISELLADNKIFATIKRLGVADRFIEQGSRELLLSKSGLNEENIKKSIIALSKK